MRAVLAVFSRTWSSFSQSPLSVKRWKVAELKLSWMVILEARSGIYMRLVMVRTIEFPTLFAKMVDEKTGMLNKSLVNVCRGAMGNIVELNGGVGTSGLRECHGVAHRVKPHDYARLTGMEHEYRFVALKAFSFYPCSICLGFPVQCTSVFCVTRLTLFGQTARQCIICSLLCFYWWDILWKDHDRFQLC